MAEFRQSLGEANLSVTPRENPAKGKAGVTVPQRNLPQVVAGPTCSGAFFQAGVWAVGPQPLADDPHPTDERPSARPRSGGASMGEAMFQCLFFFLGFTSPFKGSVGGQSVL